MFQVNTCRLDVSYHGRGRQRQRDIQMNGNVAVAAVVVAVVTVSAVYMPPSQRSSLGMCFEVSGTELAPGMYDMLYSHLVDNLSGGVFVPVVRLDRIRVGNLGLCVRVRVCVFEWNRKHPPIDHSSTITDCGNGTK